MGALRTRDYGEKTNEHPQPEGTQCLNAQFESVDPRAPRPPREALHAGGRCIGRAGHHRQGRGKAVNAASILGVISLGIDHDDEVTLAADGDNADAVLDQLVELLSTDHDE
jgi:hypothetical protein